MKNKLKEPSIPISLFSLPKMKSFTFLHIFFVEFNWIWVELSWFESTWITVLLLIWVVLFCFVLMNVNRVTITRYCKKHTPNVCQTFTKQNAPQGHAKNFNFTSHFFYFTQLLQNTTIAAAKSSISFAFFKTKPHIFFLFYLGDIFQLFFYFAQIFNIHHFFFVERSWSLVTLSPFCETFTTW